MSIWVNESYALYYVTSSMNDDDFFGLKWASNGYWLTYYSQIDNSDLGENGIFAIGKTCTSKNVLIDFAYFYRRKSSYNGSGMLQLSIGKTF